MTGQERDFFSTWFSPINGQVVSVIIEAETNIFDPDNYYMENKSKEKFQVY